MRPAFLAPAFLAPAVLVLAAPSAATATTILVDSGERIQTISFADPLGQTFKAPGINLVSVGLQFATLNPTAPQNTLTVAIRKGASLTGTVLASRTFLPANVGRFDPKVFTHLDFTGVTLVLGAMYTITVVNNGAGARNGIVFGPNLLNPPFGTEFGPDAYPDGELLFTGSLGGCGINPPSCDLNFKVETFAIPEPATWAMLIAGFGMVGGALRRRAARLA
jgi:hypothetical protein